MSEFVIKKKKKPVEIKDEAGSVLASYEINVGNYNELKKWMSKVGDIEDMAKGATSDKASLDNLVELEREIVNMVTDGDWDNLWALCEENVFTMLSIVRFFSEQIRDGISSLTSEYL